MSALLPAPADIADGGASDAAWRNAHRGWTPDRQRTFLEAIAEGHTVEDACRIVGLTKQSAYALRKRAAGTSFALGWAAANLLARDTLADALLTRAIQGQVDTYTRADGETVTRHRYDNRLATTMLARLDRQVETAPGTEAHAARLVAREFDAFLALIDRADGPARTGLFLAARAADGDDPDLDAITTLARADRWLKTGAGTPVELDVSDLDPAERAAWTGEQWVRAEAAGLVRIAPDDTAGSSQLRQLDDDGDDADDDDDDEANAPVWYDRHMGGWYTRFPPPAGFDGEETGVFGDDDYERDCTLEESVLLEADAAVALRERYADGDAERARWFAALRRAAGEAAADAEDEAIGDAEGAEADPPTQPSPLAGPRAALFRSG